MRLQTHWCQRRAAQASFSVPLGQLPRLYFARTASEFRASGISRAGCSLHAVGGPDVRLSLAGVPRGDESHTAASTRSAGTAAGAGAASALSDDQLRQLRESLQEGVHSMVAAALQQQLPQVEKTVRAAVRNELFAGAHSTADSTSGAASLESFSV